MYNKSCDNWNGTNMITTCVANFAKVLKPRHAATPMRILPSLASPGPSAKKLMILVVGMAVACLPVDLVADDNIQTSESTDSAIVQAGPRALSKAFRVAARTASPSVVTVLSYGQEMGAAATRTNNTGDHGQDKPGDDAGPNESAKTAAPDEKQLTGLGSGVILTEDGIVITNNHVIAGAKRVVVQMADESEYTATKVYGDRASDVATLRIERDTPFPSATTGDSDELEIGDWVLAIGSPFRLEATVSAGIISAKNRKLGRIERARMIQTDAAINPGNSGGPLIDLDGRVIAINTAIVTRSTGYQGVGFAIPINQAEWIARELDKHGRVRRAAIGVRMAELKPRIAAKFNLPVGQGVLAYQVINDSAGDRAGIQPLDVIVEFAHEKVRDPGSLQELVERLPVGSVQSIKVLRNGEVLDLEIELASIDDPTLGVASENANETETPEPEVGVPIEQ